MKNKFLAKYSPFQIGLFLVIILAVVSMGLMYNRMSKAEATFQEKRAENQAMYAALKSEIERYDTLDAEAELERMNQDLTTATKRGALVAKYQTEFFNCVTMADPVEARLNNQDTLMAFIDDSEALPAGGIVGFMPWFSSSRDTRDLVWVFKTTYAFSDATLPVVWELRDTQNQLMAFAYGEYVRETELFRNIIVQTTAIGANTYRPDDTGIPDDVYDTSLIPVTDDTGISGEEWDGDTGSLDEDLQEELEGILDAREDAVQNGPPQSEIDANNALREDPNLGVGDVGGDGDGETAGDRDTPEASVPVPVDPVIVHEPDPTEPSEGGATS